jgi:putative ribosome biogenesis GTPase RsgA
LRGWDSECEALDRLLEAVHAGESRVLVLSGEPGTGKSALLEYLAERASNSLTSTVSRSRKRIRATSSGHSSQTAGAASRRLTPGVEETARADAAETADAPSRDSRLRVVLELAP